MKLRILIAILVSARVSLADDQEHPGKLKNWDLNFFSGGSPQELTDHFRALIDDHPRLQSKKKQPVDWDTTASCVTDLRLFIE